MKFFGSLFSSRTSHASNKSATTSGFSQLVNGQSSSDIQSNNSRGLNLINPLTSLGTEGNKGNTHTGRYDDGVHTQTLQSPISSNVALKEISVSGNQPARIDPGDGTLSLKEQVHALSTDQALLTHCLGIERRYERGLLAQPWTDETFDRYYDGYLAVTGDCDVDLYGLMRMSPRFELAVTEQTLLEDPLDDPEIASVQFESASITHHGDVAICDDLDDYSLKDDHSGYALRG